MAPELIPVHPREILNGMKSPRSKQQVYRTTVNESEALQRFPTVGDMFATRHGSKESVEKVRQFSLQARRML